VVAGFKSAQQILKTWKNQGITFDLSTHQSLFDSEKQWFSGITRIYNQLAYAFE